MKTILGFGASTMQGVGDPSGGFFSRLPHHPALLGQALDFKNHGIGGNSLSDMLPRVPQAGAFQPYDLIVILGCNDLPRRGDLHPEKRSSLEQYQARVEELLRRIQGQQSLFITSFSVCEKRTGIAPSQLTEYMSAALNIARSLGYDLWDLHHESLTRASEFWAADGLHFNAGGHQFIAGEVADWIREKLAEPVLHPRPV